MMERLENIKTIYEFKNSGIVYGCYSLKCDGDDKVFIRNGDSVAVVAHRLGEPADTCAMTIRNDVKEKFFSLLKSDCGSPLGEQKALTCTDCLWNGERHQKCSCCRRNSSLKDNFTATNQQKEVKKDEETICCHNV